MQLVLVRSASPDPPGTPVLPGDPEPGLGPQGHLQAGSAAAGLASEDVVAVYCSPRRRAVETADHVADRLAVTAEVLDGLAPIRLGDPPGVHDDHRPRDGEPGTPGWSRLLDGQRGDPEVHAFRHRASRALEGITEAHRGGTVVVVSHASVINAYLADVLDTPDTFVLPLLPASVTRVRVLAPARRLITELNSVGNLPAGAGRG